MRRVVVLFKSLLIISLIINLLPLNPSNKAYADPGTYTRVIPYQSMPGTSLLIEWDFDTAHYTDIEVYKSDGTENGTLIKTIVNDRFYEVGQHMTTPVSSLFIALSSENLST